VPSKSSVCDSSVNLLQQSLSPPQSICLFLLITLVFMHPYSLIGTPFHAGFFPLLETFLSLSFQLSFSSDIPSILMETLFLTRIRNMSFRFLGRRRNSGILWVYTKTTPSPIPLLLRFFRKPLAQGLFLQVFSLHHASPPANGTKSSCLQPVTPSDQ